MDSKILIKKSFMYDEFSDSLMIFNLKNKDPVVGSVNVLNLIIDLTIFTCSPFLKKKIVITWVS